MARSGAPSSGGPPPLRPFGLVLHRDGRWTHEGRPVTHPRLRAAFDRSVRYLPDERVYVVQLGRFRGQIEVEETGFFVRSFDAEAGAVVLSDDSREALDPATLSLAPSDGAPVCRVKRALAPGGLPARFTHAAHAELLASVEEGAEGPVLRTGGRRAPCPGLAEGA